MNTLYFLWAIPCLIMLLAQMPMIVEEFKLPNPDYRDICWMIGWAILPIANIIMLGMYIYCMVTRFKGIK